MGSPAQCSVWNCSLPCHADNHRYCEAFFLQLLVKNIQLEDGRMIPASRFFSGADSSVLELTEAELVMAETVRVKAPFRDSVLFCRLCTASVFFDSHSLELDVYTLCRCMC